MKYDVAIIGAGISGLATALRLQSRGAATLLLESHYQAGGCAGYFRRRGFSFDVGATTLVDFSEGGVGGRFLEEVGIGTLPGETLHAYEARLPDRTVTLYRDPERWNEERLALFGATTAHRRFWAFLDSLAETFWEAARRGARLPFRRPEHLLQTLRAIPPARWMQSRYLFSTMEDALRSHGLQHDLALRGLLRALLEDTVHAPLHSAPLINGALGATIRGAGLTRARGGMRGLITLLVNRYRELGGTLSMSTDVQRVTRTAGGDAFELTTSRGVSEARFVVSTLPIWNTAALGLPDVERVLARYLRRDEKDLGSALVVFLGVPEDEVAGEPLTHHHLLRDYEQPLSNGNNMFISVSAPGDTESAPSGLRAVMLSTHCDLADWENLSPDQYEDRKGAVAEHLIGQARRVYPNLGAAPAVLEVGTPRTYQRYTRRHRGAVGGMRLRLGNSNLFAVPQNLGIPGFWFGGDTTWPGLGTVACILGSRHIADDVARALKLSPAPSLARKRTFGVAS